MTFKNFKKILNDAFDKLDDDTTKIVVIRQDGIEETFDVSDLIIASCELGASLQIGIRKREVIKAIRTVINHEI